MSSSAAFQMPLKMYSVDVANTAINTANSQSIFYLGDISIGDIYVVETLG